MDSYIKFTDIVDENIIDAPKMKNIFLCSCRILNFPILDFFLLLPIRYCSSNFTIAKAVALNLFALYLNQFLHCFMASFLYCTPYSYRYSNYCDSHICLSFMKQQKVKSDNFTRSIKKSNVAIVLFEKRIIRQDHNNIAFWGHQ